MTRNRKIHPDNPNSIFLLTKKKKDLQHVRGGGPSGRTLSANTKKHKTALPSVWRPRFFQPWFSPPPLSFPLILRGRAISSWFTSTKSKVSGASFSCCAFVKPPE